MMKSINHLYMCRSSLQSKDDENTHLFLGRPENVGNPIRRKNHPITKRPDHRAHEGQVQLPQGPLVKSAKCGGTASHWRSAVRGGGGMAVAGRRMLLDCKAQIYGRKTHEQYIGRGWCFGRYWRIKREDAGSMARTEAFAGDHREAQDRTAKAHDLTGDQRQDEQIPVREDNQLGRQDSGINPQDYTRNGTAYKSQTRCRGAGQHTGRGVWDSPDKYVQNQSGHLLRSIPEAVNQASQNLANATSQLLLL